MSYEHKSNVRIKKVSLSIKVLGFIVAILLILYFFSPNFLSTFFTRIANPFWNLSKNTEIVVSNQSTELNNATIRELTLENADLKSILNRKNTGNSVLANVIKKPPYSAYDVFIIDIGSKNGIVAGDKVYSIEKILIGEIAEVFDSTSKVKLYSSYGEKYEVFVNNIQTTATGRGGGAFEIVLPRDVKIQENDIVTIPSLTSSSFGIVKRIIADPARAFSTILFSQPINIYELKWVEVDKK